MNNNVDKAGTSLKIISKKWDGQFKISCVCLVVWQDNLPTLYLANCCPFVAWDRGFSSIAGRVVNDQTSNTITTFLHPLDILRTTNYAIVRTDDALHTHVRVALSNHKRALRPLTWMKWVGSIYKFSWANMIVKVVFQHIFGARHSTYPCLLVTIKLQSSKFTCCFTLPWKYSFQYSGR